MKSACFVVAGVLTTFYLDAETLPPCGQLTIASVNSGEGFLSCFVSEEHPNRCICDLEDGESGRGFPYKVTANAPLPWLTIKAWSSGGSRRACTEGAPGDGGGSAFGAARLENLTGSLRFELAGSSGLNQLSPTRVWLDEGEATTNQILVVGGGGQAGCGAAPPSANGGGGGANGTDVVLACGIAGGGKAGTHLAAGQGGIATASSGGCIGLRNGRDGLGPGGPSTPYGLAVCQDVNNTIGTTCSGAGYYSGGSGARVQTTTPAGSHFGGAGGGGTKATVETLPAFPQLKFAYGISGGAAPYPGHFGDPDRSEENPNLVCPDPPPAPCSVVPTPSYGMGYGSHTVNGESVLPSRPRIVFVWGTPGDLNGDGKADLFLRKAANWQHDIWFMNGIQRQSSTTLVPTPTTVQQLTGVNDFDSDGFNDLALWSSANGATEFWLMNGTATRTSVEPISHVTPPSAGDPTTTNAWLLAATADLNQDSQPDLLWRKINTLKLWTMNGTQHVSELTPNPSEAVNTNWIVVAAGDYGAGADSQVGHGSQDQHTDLLWYNETSGKIVIWFMKYGANSAECSGQSSTPCYFRTSGVFTVPDSAGNANWKVLASADYGSWNLPRPGTFNVATDGRPDIVWRNATSGKYVAWIMDSGGNRMGGLFTDPDSPANPLDWTIVGPR